MDTDSDDDYECVSDFDLSDQESDQDGKNVKNVADTPSSTPPAGSSTPRASESKTLKCPYENCFKAFNRQARLKEHLRSHTNTRPFKCPHAPCTKDFLRDSHLKHHIKSAHSNIRDYTCSREGCGASFATGTRLRRHEQSHEGRERFRCRGYDGCSETFRKHETLQRHIRSVHEHMKPFPCPETDSVTGARCTKAFDTAEKLRSHQRAKHDPTRFSCSECMAHNAAVMAMATADHGPDPLELVPASFATYGELQGHVTEVHPPTCSFCSLSVSTNKELTRHLELQHGILPPGTSPMVNEFTCTHPGCGKMFSKKGNLNIHVKTVHDKRRDFVCGETQIPLPDEIDTDDPAAAGAVVVHGCGRDFTSKASLEEHVRTAHLGLESKRMKREKKRKAEKEGDGEMAKKRKPRKDKGIKRTSTMASLTGILVSQPLAADGAGTSLAATLPDEVTEDHTFLSGSMTMLGSQVFHHSGQYHYPSGEYPTNRAPSPQLFNYQNPPRHEFEFGHLHDTTMDYDVDGGFFGGFESERGPAPVLDPRLLSC